MGKIEDKTQADPLGFLLRALVSIQLQSPRTPELPSATTSTKDCARHADPKDGLIQGPLGLSHQGLYHMPRIRQQRQPLLSLVSATKSILQCENQMCY